MRKRCRTAKDAPATPPGHPRSPRAVDWRATFRTGASARIGGRGRMKIEPCEKRKSIIAEPSHALVCGGPGSGKTTVALLKAKARMASLRPGQEILFLSFSRAAVRQVLRRSTDLLTRAERRLIQVQTYHSFCIDVLHAHGRLLTGRKPKLIYPTEERIREAEFAGDWKAERIRAATEEDRYCFDQLAGATARLFEETAAVASLYSEKYPLMVVDEFQDTDDDQWRIVKALGKHAVLLCLADPDQRIFDYSDKVDPERLDHLVAE